MVDFIKFKFEKEFGNIKFIFSFVVFFFIFFRWVIISFCVNRGMNGNFLRL